MHSIGSSKYNRVADSRSLVHRHGLKSSPLMLKGASVQIFPVYASLGCHLLRIRLFQPKPSCPLPQSGWHPMQISASAFSDPLPYLAMLQSQAGPPVPFLILAICLGRAFNRVRSLCAGNAPVAERTMVRILLPSGTCMKTCPETAKSVTPLESCQRLSGCIDSIPANIREKASRARLSWDRGYMCNRAQAQCLCGSGDRWRPSMSSC